MPKTIKISVVIPVFNGEKYLPRAVESIRRNTFKDYELIIIDDCSTDSTPDLISKINPDLYLTNKKNIGHSYSRNIGAKHAKGEIIFFTDADVELYTDTLEKINNHFKNNNINCVIGLYSLPDPEKNICTIYKNSWIRFSYLKSPDKVNWFFTAVGAIRKNIWEKNRRFQNYALHSGGSDITFGLNLHNKGIDIILDKELQVIHSRLYSLSFLLKNDFNRAFGYSSIAFKKRKILSEVPRKGFANISCTFINACILALPILLSFLLSLRESRLLFICLILFLFYIAGNFSFYKFIKKHYKLITAIKCASIMFIDHVTCMCAVISAVIKVFLLDWIKNDRTS